MSKNIDVLIRKKIPIFVVIIIVLLFSPYYSIEDVVNLHGGADSICAIVTATSVFAPRVADDVPAGKRKQIAE